MPLQQQPDRTGGDKLKRAQSTAREWRRENNRDNAKRKRNEINGGDDRRMAIVTMFITLLPPSIVLIDPGC